MTTGRINQVSSFSRGLPPLSGPPPAPARPSPLAPAGSRRRSPAGLAHVLRRLFRCTRRYTAAPARSAAVALSASRCLAPAAGLPRRSPPCPRGPVSGRSGVAPPSRSFPPEPSLPAPRAPRPPPPPAPVSRAPAGSRVRLALAALGFVAVVRPRLPRYR